MKRHSADLPSSLSQRARVSRLLRVLPGWLRGVLAVAAGLSALVAGLGRAFGGDLDTSGERSIEERVAAVREQVARLEEEEAAQMTSQSDANRLAQWYNWPNWSNWYNY
jgi:uncharacterized small protein (DUF1192 family)